MHYNLSRLYWDKATLTSFQGKRFVTSSCAQPKVNNEFHLIRPLLICQQGCSHYVTWLLQLCDNLAD